MDYDQEHTLSVHIMGQNGMVQDSLVVCRHCIFYILSLFFQFLKSFGNWQSTNGKIYFSTAKLQQWQFSQLDKPLVLLIQSC